MLDGATVDGATPEPITGAFSVIASADEGIATKVRTRARPGHVHAVWCASADRRDQGLGRLGGRRERWPIPAGRLKLAAPPGHG